MRVAEAMGVRPLLLATFLGLTSCAVDAKAPDVEIGAPARPAIIRGTASAADQDSVVMIVIWSGTDRAGVCTGTAIAPTLVLTARHCVSIEGPGNSLTGDRAPADLDVRVGPKITAAEVDNRATATAKGKRFFIPEADSVFNADFAVIEVDRPLGVPAAPLRLDGAVSVDEELTLVGWGATENGQLPDTRQQRTGVKVVAVGTAASTSDYDVGADEFRIGEGTCFGDSGGPSLSARSGAVIGVVSRGGNGTRDPTNVAAACVGAKVADVHTLISRYRPLLDNAFRATGATPQVERKVEDPPDDGCAMRGRTRQGDRHAGTWLFALALVSWSVWGRRRRDARGVRRARPSRAR